MNICCYCGGMNCPHQCSRIDLNLLICFCAIVLLPVSSDTTSRAQGSLVQDFVAFLLVDLPAAFLLNFYQLLPRDCTALFSFQLRV